MLWSRTEAKLLDKFKPTFEQRRAFHTYMEWWNDWKTFGMPRDGGLSNQEAEWVDAVRLVNNAFEKVQQEAEEEARLAAQKKNK